jgi:RNA polymerase-binding transcription factor DksA
MEQVIRQTQERWFVFLEKLEARMEEMCSAAIPELKTVFEEDQDPYKRAHGRMLAGLLGQLHQIRDKANEVKEQQIIPLLYSGHMLHPFREACFNRHYAFEDRLNRYVAQLQETAGRRDLEAFYQEQLAAFEQIKDQFCCKQCGGKIPVPKMFFIATYLSCAYCQTQNTFLPSSGAQLVLHQARSLAEQRTAHLLKAYENSRPKDPALYRQYLRAMFDEWNKIVPDMAEENEKFHLRLLKDYNIDHL